MTHYPIKILMAFGCTFEPEGDEFFEWLMRNGYPELGALSQTIQGVGRHRQRHRQGRKSRGMAHQKPL